MAEKKWILFGAGILLALIGFIAANKYWFYPTLTAQIAPPPGYTSPSDTPNIVVIKPFEGTLSKIIQQPDPTDIDPNPIGTSRNPFLWHGELTPPPPPKKNKKVQPVEIPRLGMIITGEDRQTVMLDNNLVHPGESYGGHVVESISPEFVILSGDYGVLKISMPQMSFGAPKVDILEEKDPNLLIEPVLTDKRQRDVRQ